MSKNNGLRGGMGAKYLTPDELNRRRRQAVRLRLDGHTVEETGRRCGLSAPTVSAAFKAFREGGWPGVDVRPRGRRTGQGRSISAEVGQRLSERLMSGPDASTPLWELRQTLAWLADSEGINPSERALRRWLDEHLGMDVKPRPGRRPRHHPGRRWLERLRERGGQCLEVRVGRLPAGEGASGHRLVVTGPRSKRWFVCAQASFEAQRLIKIFDWLKCQFPAPLGIWVEGLALEQSPEIVSWRQTNRGQVELTQPRRPASRSRRQGERSMSTHGGPGAGRQTQDKTLGKDMTTLTHLQRLEAESIHIMREVVAETENPVMLYSIGKDSAVMLHLARKAFAPGPPPFPLLHVDTRWKFRAMYEFRDWMVEQIGMDLLVHINPEGIEKDIDPFVHGSAIHTDIMKTDGLKQALDKYGFDAAFGGARRDEEKSRAKERVFSFRSAQHRWDPKNQRPELWKLYNARKHKGESIRVFPLSNWTELDIWQYIYLENIPIVPLYYSAERPVVERGGTLIMVDDERMPLNEGEVPMMKKVRFRTLGCYPLTGAIESEADTLANIIQEMLLATTSERQGRMIDHDSAASMEKKKQEGYF